MLLWYKDEELEIHFSDIPCTTMMFPLPSMTKEEKKAIKKKPFLNKRELYVTIIDKQKEEPIEYRFRIERGYRWDGASIPPLFWMLIGPKTDPKFQIPSMIHDKMCENHSYIGNDRRLSTQVFEKCLVVSDVWEAKRKVMFHAIDFWQRFQHWKKQNRK